MSKNTTELNLILDTINHTKLTASECSDIFNALISQNEVICCKFWTTNDIKQRLCENYNVKVSDNDIEVVAKDINYYTNLDEPTFSELHAIDSAIRDAAIKIHVSDIIWDVDKAEFDNITEYQTVVENLPTSIDIPLSALEYNVDIIDYLHNEYGYFVEAYCTEEYSNF